MKIVSFNVNGIRARPHQLEAVRDQLNPDVIGLQEIKVQDEDFPLGMIEELGYHAEYFGQKGHYGVALLSKKPPVEVLRGYASDDADAQRRMITGIYETPKGGEVTIMNGYFPQGESRDHPVKFPNKALHALYPCEITDFMSKQVSCISCTGHHIVNPGSGVFRIYLFLPGGRIEAEKNFLEIAGK